MYGDFLDLAKELRRFDFTGIEAALEVLAGITPLELVRLKKAQEMIRQELSAEAYQVMETDMSDNTRDYYKKCLDRLQETENRIREIEHEMMLGGEE